MFLSNVFYNTYTVVFTYYRGKEVWHEYWQLTRPRWTARESKMVWTDLHDAVTSDLCIMATARVYYGTMENWQFYRQLIMHFCTSTFSDVIADALSDESGNKKVVRRWATITPDEV